MKKFFCILFAICIFLSNICVYASDNSKNNYTPEINGGNSDDAGNFGHINITPQQPGTEITGIVSNVLGTMQWVGYAIAIGMLIYIGIKYIVSSADDKASIKNVAFKYVLGAFLISGAVTVASWVFNIL